MAYTLLMFGVKVREKDTLEEAIAFGLVLAKSCIEVITVKGTDGTVCGECTMDGYTDFLADADECNDYDGDGDNDYAEMGYNPYMGCVDDDC